jgi:hypothetical protein
VEVWWFPKQVVSNTNFVRTRPVLKVPIELGVICLFLWLALPFACGIFPQKSSISASKLESQFHTMKDADGNPIETFFYNRGL